MENKDAKKILNGILESTLISRDYIKNEFKKENKTNKEKIAAVRTELKQQTVIKNLQQIKLKNSVLIKR